MLFTMCCDVFVLLVVQQLRELLPESMAIASMMSTFLEFFAEGKPLDYAETPAVQIEFCGLLLMLLDRTPALDGDTPLQEHSFFKKVSHISRWTRANRRATHEGESSRLYDCRCGALACIFGNFNTSCCAPKCSVQCSSFGG